MIATKVLVSNQNIGGNKLMTPRSLELAEWKLSVVSHALCSAAGDEESFLSPEILFGLCEIMNDVKTLMKATTGGSTHE